MADLIETAKECLPNDKETIMTVGEQLRRQGVQQGMQDGIYLVAKNLLANGAEIPFVAKCTGLAPEMIIKLRKKT